MSMAMHAPLPQRWRIAVPVIALLLVTLLWESAVRSARGQGVAPLPSGMLAAAVKMTLDGSLATALAGSLQRVLTGFAISAVIGIPLGLLIGTVDTLDRALRPVLDGLRSIAPIAWIPMAILWLGVRGNAALFVVAYAAVFPFIVNTSQAARSVDRRLVQAAQALGAGRRVMLASVLWPSALPLIFTGARIALAFAWASIIAAELAIGIKVSGTGKSIAGIGQLMVETLYVQRDPDALVCYMLAIGVISLAIDAGLRRAQALLLPWSAR